jgi:hypothetical protein
MTDKLFLPMEFQDGVTPMAWRGFMRRCVVVNGATIKEMQMLLQDDGVLEFEQGLVLCTFLSGMGISEACSACLVSEERFTEWRESSFNFRQAFICCNLLMKTEVATDNKILSKKDREHLKWMQERDKDYGTHYSKDDANKGVVVNNMIAPIHNVMRSALESMAPTAQLPHTPQAITQTIIDNND